MSDSAVLKKKDFDLQITKVKSDSADSLKLDDVERQTIIDAINKFGGNLSKASLELGLGRTTLYRKIQKYGL
jgi:transcriptional regulator of acetoin/glycerol metabolism